MPTTDRPTTGLEIRRTIAATPEKVYQAWTHPATVAKWFGPSTDYTVTVRELDVRIGGRYRIEMLHKGGNRHVAAGHYRELVPGVRLVFTWRWEENTTMPDTLVTIDLVRKSGGTELVLSHQLFENQEQRDQHEQGWTECLDRLPSAINA